MAIGNWQENWSGQEVGEQSPDGQVGIKRAKRKLTVTVTDPVNDSEMVVRADPGCPRVSQQHPRDLSQFCIDVNVRRVSMVMYEVSADYQVSVTAMGPGSDNSDPTNNEPSVEWDSVDTEEPIDEDADGNAIMTKTKEAFDPPITREFSDGMIRITKYMLFYDESFFSAFRNTVNSQILYGMPVGTVKCRHIKGKRLRNENGYYYEVYFEFHTRRGAPRTTDAKAWYRRVRAEGFYRLNGAGDRLRVLDDNGEPVVVPALHDKDTGLLITDPANAQWYEWKVFASADHNLLGV